MNASALSPDIQQEAAKSLLERLREKTALVRFFRYNASAKHGVPVDPDREIVLRPPVVVEDKDQDGEPQRKEEPQSPHGLQNIIYTGGTSAANTNAAWKTAALVLAILSGAAGIGAVGWLLGQGAQSSATPFVQSPYQFIEDMGAHWYE